MPKLCSLAYRVCLAHDGLMDDGNTPSGLDQAIYYLDIIENLTMWGCSKGDPEFPNMETGNRKNVVSAFSMKVLQSLRSSTGRCAF